MKLPHIGTRFYFSFSTIVNGRSNKLDLRVKAIPHDRLLIESDVHDSGDTVSAMASICQSVSTIRGWSLFETAQRTTANAQSFLKSCYH
ncbi:hypothetical protein BASA50_005571 [Batrachochytrium salamandrivorans]|uniref:Uncharacterized protein n=1 Tax=Batrachochytrium salamandrivorans TaxID=1357716 RepID=A0ABQ8FCF0_9FUNG|nr:hypothetical protein BASA50_005571 [Batrachochytrium salamandrivorans]